MTKKILMVVAQTGFRDEELFVPKDIFEQQGYVVEVIAQSSGLCKGMLGGVVDAQQSIASVVLDKHVKAIVLVGGANAPSLMEVDALEVLLKSAVKNKLVIGAICIAPMVLAYFDVLKGVHATVFACDESLDMLRSHGAVYFPEDVLTDDLIVTANGAHAAEEFAQAILDVL